MAVLISYLSFLFSNSLLVSGAFGGWFCLLVTTSFGVGGLFSPLDRASFHPLRLPSQSFGNEKLSSTLYFVSTFSGLHASLSSIVRVAPLDSRSLNPNPAEFGPSAAL